jgi:acetylornithine/succinyldiaminopimelate/putrescine aminotransferase
MILIFNPEKIMKLKTAERKYFGRENDALEIEVSRAEDSFIYDRNGKRYIDLFMGWCVGNFGWNNPEVKKTVRNYDGADYIYPGFHFKPWVELAEVLAKITPGNLEKSFRATGGSEANEAALQMAMLYTKRNKFLSMEESYHGNTIATISIGSSESQEKFGNLLPNCKKIAMPPNAKALSKAETHLKKKDIAAFIIEPVICNYHTCVPDQEFMSGIRDLCTKYGTLLIIDEVATGFGRTGKLFGCEHFNIVPDIMTMSKAIAGGAAGLGAAITTHEIANKIKDDFQFYSTFGWHPLSTIAALANIKYILKHKVQLLDHVNEMGNLFMERLNGMDIGEDAEVWGKGLAITLNLNDSKRAKKVAEKCRKDGLLIHQESEGLQFFPALNIKKKVALEALDILESNL